jgi:methyltransferase
MIFFFSFLAFVIAQRLAELFYAQKNRRKMLALGALEYDAAGYRLIVVMHLAFFASLLAEMLFYRRNVSDFWYLFIVLFAAAQFLRYWAIISLGMFWNTRIIILKDSVRINKGPYRYLSHPNYAAVIVELAVVPMMFNCYITAIVFTFVNLLVLSRRIMIENRIMRQLMN